MNARYRVLHDNLLLTHEGGPSVDAYARQDLARELASAVSLEKDAEIARLRRDAERWQYCRDKSSWIRSDDAPMDYMAVWVAKGADLSSPAMREAAIDSAKEATKWTPHAPSPTPSEVVTPRNVFYASAQKFESPESVLTGGQIKAIANISNLYPLYQDTFGRGFMDDVPIGDSEAVNIAEAVKHFYGLIPATTHKSYDSL